MWTVSLAALLSALVYPLLMGGCSVKPTAPAAPPQAPASAPAPAPAASAPEAKPVESPIVARTEPPAPPPMSASSVDARSAAPAESRVAQAQAKPTAPAAQPAPKKEVAQEPAKKQPAQESAKKETAQEPSKPSEPPLDIGSLETRLKDTRAIGLMTKIALKNQVDDLLNQFRGFYAGKVKTTLAELRHAYDLLVLKVLSLLQDSDPALATAIVASREAIWGILSDRVKFANFATS